MTAEGTVMGVPEKWLGLFKMDGKEKGGEKRVLEACGKCGARGVYPVSGGREGLRACSAEHLKALRGV